MTKDGIVTKRSGKARKGKRLGSSRRRGVSTVEFVLVFPILMTFFGAMIVFAQANLLRDTAQYAAYEGARSAIVPGATSERVLETTKSTLAIVDMREAEITVRPAVITDDVPEVQVSVSVPMGPNLWWIAATPFIPENWRLQAGITMKREIGNEN